MCGFVGYTSSEGIDSEIISKMMNTIVHRGPDSDGVHIDDKIAIGFRRLSIIGLEDGSQPIYNEDKSLTLVFNGEIYNYQDIKDDLVEKGHVFYTHTDSEVLVHGYEEYGVDILQKLRGMFAFCIWNHDEEKLFMARDYFGIKPLYYYKDEDHFIFGSEIKGMLEHPAIHKELNMEALECYLTFQYSVLPETFFKGVFRLPPAHYLTLENNEINVQRYWEPTFDIDESANRSLEDVVDEIDDVMQDSIKAHKISDTEVGSFLSSGVDSSYIAACCDVDKTFTVGFDYEQYDETQYAKHLSEHIGVQNYSKIVTTEEYWDVLPKVQYHMDEPNADPAAVALYFVSQIASEHVKVALSGEGADELFGGYNIYREPLDLAPFTRLPRFIRKALGAIGNAIPFDIKGKNFLIRLSKDVEERFIGNAKMFSVKERKALLRKNTAAPLPMELTSPFYEKVKDQHDVTKMQYIDMNFWLWGDILQKADRMSMAHSLEVRVPFLDKEVFKVASRIPVKYKVNKKNTKYAMRLAANRHIPEEVAAKKKLGFPVPIRVWLKDPKYYGIVKEAFNSEVSRGIFQQEELVKLLDDHFNGKRDNSRKIWVIYMFLIWYKEFFNETN